MKKSTHYPSAITALSLCAAVFLLSACSEKPQTAGTHRPSHQVANGVKSGFVAPGWQPGQPASWEEQIKLRNRGQNEYARMTP